MRLILALLCLTIAAFPAMPEPVADADRVPIDLRRTTLVVRDIDASLAFYRDALGMQVIYDNAIRTPRDAATDEEADRASRLVFLRANDTFIGVLGLLEYVKPRKPAHNQGAEPFTPGSIVLLFNSQDVDAAFGRAKDVIGTRVLAEPRETSYPSYDGSGSIAVKVSVLTDPDGFVVELNQLLTDAVR